MKLHQTGRLKGSCARTGINGKPGRKRTLALASMPIDKETGSIQSPQNQAPSQNFAGNAKMQHFPWTSQKSFFASFARPRLHFRNHARADQAAGALPMLMTPRDNEGKPQMRGPGRELATV